MIKFSTFLQPEMGQYAEQILPILFKSLEDGFNALQVQEQYIATLAAQTKVNRFDEID